MSKRYSVGSVCTIVKAHSDYVHLIGRDCTVLSNDGEGNYTYFLEIQGYNGNLYSGHEHIKLKHLPPEQDAWCRDVMKKITGDAPLSSKGDILIVKETT